MDVVVITRGRSRQLSSEDGDDWQAVVGSAPMSTPDATTVDVVINGQPRSVNAGTTIAGLIELLGLGERRVAVERNREVVPRALHAATVLERGDRLELVTFVGGG